MAIVNPSRLATPVAGRLGWGRDRPLISCTAGITYWASRIVELRLESQAVVRAAVYIDATYEGDLMAAAREQAREHGARGFVILHHEQPQ